MQSLKVRGPCGSLDFQTLLVLGPLQKLLLPFIFHGSVPLLQSKKHALRAYCPNLFTVVQGTQVGTLESRAGSTTLAHFFLRL